MYKNILKYVLCTVGTYSILCVRSGRVHTEVGIHRYLHMYIQSIYLIPVGAGVYCTYGVLVCVAPTS